MNILKKFWHSIATQFIPQKLCASVKNKIKTFVERFERKPLNNNPQLTKLMKTDLSFKELQKLKDEYILKIKLLRSEIGSLQYSKMLYGKEPDKNKINQLNNEIYQTQDLLTGIEAKIAEIGFKYEYKIKKELPLSSGGIEIWESIETIILEKNYNEPFTSNDLIEFMTQINIKSGEVVICIRKILK